MKLVNIRPNVKREIDSEGNSFKKKQQMEMLATTLKFVLTSASFVL